MATYIELHEMLTEKSLRAQEQNTAVFRVRPFATKYQVGIAIKERFNVIPKAIRMSRIRPRTRRRGLVIGSTSAWKKAYVKVDDVTKLSSQE